MSNPDLNPVTHGIIHPADPPRERIGLNLNGG